MGKIHAVITGVGGYVPDYVLNNEELSRMVDTSDEWIMTRVGIKERHILTEEGLGTSYMARKAAKQLLKKTGDKVFRFDIKVSGEMKIKAKAGKLKDEITIRKVDTPNPTYKLGKDAGNAGDWV